MLLEVALAMASALVLTMILLVIIRLVIVGVIPFVYLTEIVAQTLVMNVVTAVAEQPCLLHTPILRLDFQ